MISKGHLSYCVHCSVFHNSRDAETAWIHQQLDELKKKLVETNNGYYSAFIKRGNPTIFNNLNEPGGCYVK